MNRFHQIENTLLKNLKDNYVDKNDIEFVIVDINSKDEFREWIKTNNDLKKYIECGYLKYYETETLNEWHLA